MYIQYKTLFSEFITNTLWSSNFGKKKVIQIRFLFLLLKIHLPLLQLLIQGGKCLLYHQIWGRFAKKLRSSFGVTYRKLCDVGLKWRALKAKQDCLFWSSEKLRKGYSKINNIFKSYLQKWIISHPRVIHSPIEKDYIKVKSYGRNRG